jgi:two-component system, OmpR family, response regulator ResD
MAGEDRMEPEREPALILVADDDPHIVRLLTLYLGKAGFRVETAADGDETLRKIRDLHPDLVVLDVMMPGPDGLEVCRTVRRSSDLPIIILSARGGDVDRIAGLQFGADDYVAKPFNPVEVVTRVQTVLRRTASRPEAAPAANRLTVGELAIDLTERSATLAGQPLVLRPREFDLLATFARFPGFALDRDRLLDLVWGSRYYGDQRTVDVHVSWLREKLAGSRLRIETVWGVGYKLVEGSDESAPPRRRGRAPGRGV